MINKSVNIKVAWIGFSAIIIAAIISGLFIIKAPNDKGFSSESSIKIKDNLNSPVSGKVDNQTNNYFQNDTNLLNKILNKKMEGIECTTRISEKSHMNHNNSNKNNNNNNGNLYIENMSGGVAVGKVENLSITTNKSVEEILPFEQCVEINVVSDADDTIIEIKVKHGEWSPFVVGIPLDEKEFINPSIYDTRSSIIPGINSFQGTYILSKIDTIEINGVSVKYWLESFQTPILTKSNSIFIKCKKLPSNIICGIYPEIKFVYYFDN
jgi:hypothetical protein